MSVKLKPSTKVYERDSRGKMTNRWKMQHHTPSGTKTDELIKMYNDPNFSKKKHLVLKELKKRGVTLLEEQKKLKPKNLIHPGNGCLS